VARYRLIFRGELVPGVSREAFIARVAQRLDERIEQVEQTFFGKRAVVLKATDDRDEARRYQEAFKQVGAVLELKGGGRGGIRWAAAVLVLLVLLGAAAAWYSQPLWRNVAHPDIARAEAALASPGLVALVHVDVRRGIAIENRFMGGSDLNSLPGAAGDTLWTALRQAGVEPRTAIQQAVVAARVEAGEWRLAAIVLGEFDPASVRRGLEAAYEPADGAGEHFYFRMLDPETCEPSPVMAAAMTTERVVVAPASRIEQLLQRYRTGSEPAVELAEWRRFRADRILSAGVFAPRSLADTAGGMAGMLLQGAGSHLAALDSAFIGLGARALPPGANLAVAIHAADTDWIAEQHATARTALDSARRTLGQQSLALAKLLQRIKLERAPHRLAASINLDRDFRDQLATGVSEAMSAAFDPGTISGGDGAAAERLVENPDRFLPQMTAAELPSFDDIEDSAFTAQWSDGPFGLRIQEAGVVPDDDGRAYLVLEAHGRDLPNVADEASNVRLRVQDVLDAEGQSIMPQPECGADRNQDPVVFQSRGAGSYFRDGEFVNYRKHVAEKQIQLAPRAGLESIGQIQGAIELELPVQTVREELQPPLAGKQVQRNGARVAFKAGGERMLSFETSGELSRILAIRALNADGQVLDSRGQTSMSRLFGAGKAINRNISGDIDRVEIIFATRLEALRHPFTLHTADPPQDDSHYTRPEPTLADAAAMDAALDAGVPQQAQTFNHVQPQATATVGPVVVALQDLRTGGFYDFYARLRLRTPIIDGLGWNLSAGEIEITEVAAAGGEWSALGLHRVFQLEPQGMTVNGVFQPDEDRPFMQADVDLRGAYDGPGVKRLRGSVHLRAPTALQSERLEPFRLGQVVQAGELQLTPVAVAVGSVRIAGGGRRDRLVGIHLLDGQGRRVDSGVRFEHGEGGDWSARVSIGSKPVAMRMVSADALVERSYDFTLEIE